MVAVAAVAVHFVYRFIIEMTRVPRPSKSVPARAADPLITVINLQRCLINLIIEGLAFLVFLLLSPSSFFLFLNGNWISAVAVILRFSSGAL